MVRKLLQPTSIARGKENPWNCDDIFNRPEHLEKSFHVRKKVPVERVLYFFPVERIHWCNFVCFKPALLLRYNNTLVIFYLAFNSYLHLK